MYEPNYGEIKGPEIKHKKYEVGIYLITHVPTIKLKSYYLMKQIRMSCDIWCVMNVIFDIIISRYSLKNHFYLKTFVEKPIFFLKIN